MICKKCNGKNIKKRKNYTHGKNSKGIITMMCKDCGSSNIEESSYNNRRRKNFKR